MPNNHFVDYYELLQISQNAHIETIDRVFRHLAQRYHPDNQDTGDSKKFQQVVEAYNTLKDTEKRAKYDLQHQTVNEYQWGLVKEVTGNDGFETDVKTQERLLSLLYVRCRNDVKNPGLGNLDLERFLGCPSGHMEFHLWYLKSKGWIYRTETGLYAITADGVDQANLDRQRLKPELRITDQTNHYKETDT